MQTGKQTAKVNPAVHFSGIGKSITSLSGKVKVKVSICIAHLANNASNALSSLTRAASRTATTCSLQTQANAAAG